MYDIPFGTTDWSQMLGSAAGGAVAGAFGLQSAFIPLGIPGAAVERAIQDLHGGHLNVSRHMKTIVLAILVVWSPLPAFAQGALTTPDVAAEVRCKALEDADFLGLEDAPTKVMSARVVGNSGPLPAYCQVEGYVSPNVGFDLRLPIATWNGKLLEFGNGGEGGSFPTEWPGWHACDAPLKKGYACIVTDTGHKGGGGLWAANNLQALIDFAYRSVHVTAIAGKAISEKYYAKAPIHAYFEGCSTGGQEALLEAQRFPWDFDGIIADGPWINDADSSMHMVWGRRSLTGVDGKALLTRADVELLHNAALARCDMDEGVKDGLISNPPACKFDPSELLCKPGQSGRCFSPDQIQAANKVYGGPVNSKGEKIYPGGVAIGSELSWVDGGMDLIRTDGRPSVADWALTYFRYMCDSASRIALADDRLRL